MLTADLVRARRRGTNLHLLKLDPPRRQRAIQLAGQYIQIAQACLGQTREVFDEACAAVFHEGPERRLALGLCKLVEDRCQFEAASGIDPRALRREVFLRASGERKALPAYAPFERTAVLQEVATEQGLTVEELEGQLYLDLRSAHQLLAFAPLGAEELVTCYEQAQVQAVLLRAVRVTAQVTCRSPGTLRRLFHRLKFLRLLFTMDPCGKGTYRLIIDGPYSLFSSVTKYGLQLALALPALQECDRWTVQADLLWGQSRMPLSFTTAGRLPSARAKAPRAATEATTEGKAAPAAAAERPTEAFLADEVQALYRAFSERKSPWRVAPSAEILSLPGVGLCVPDLVFEHEQLGRVVYLEVMGYWSREAVWRRVALVEQGLLQRILFAVSSHLRVSEAVLDKNLPGALYVYKRVMHAGAIEQKLDALARRE